MSDQIFQPLATQPPPLPLRPTVALPTRFARARRAATLKHPSRSTPPACTRHTASIDKKALHFSFASRPSSRSPNVNDALPPPPVGRCLEPGGAALPRHCGRFCGGDSGGAASKNCCVFPRAQNEAPGLSDRRVPRAGSPPAAPGGVEGSAAVPHVMRRHLQKNWQSSVAARGSDLPSLARPPEAVSNTASGGRLGQCRGSVEAVHGSVGDQSASLKPPHASIRPGQWRGSALAVTDPLPHLGVKTGPRFC